MTLLATIVSAVIVVSLVLAEIEKYSNIFEALFTGVEKKVVKKELVEKRNMKKAFA